MWGVNESTKYDVLLGEDSTDVHRLRPNFAPIAKTHEQVLKIIRFDRIIYQHFQADQKEGGK